MINDQSTLGFVISQTEKIETTVWQKKYPEITYATDIPVDTTGNKWISGVTFFSRDDVGKAALMSGKADDVPMANTTREKHSTGVEMGGIGYEFSDEEIGQAQMLGMDLNADGALAARRSYERFVDDAAYLGNSELDNGEGLYSLSSAVSTPASTPWDNPSVTADSILEDVNKMLTRIYDGTHGMEYADTLHISTKAFGAISSKRLSDHSDTTVLEYVKTANIYTATTGQPLRVRGDYRLAGKAVAYRRDPEVLRLHIPMPLEFKAPETRGLYTVVNGRFRLSGLEVRTPKAIEYLTGVSS